jgi:hypothetical protein
MWYNIRTKFHEDCFRSNVGIIVGKEIQNTSLRWSQLA